MDAASKLRARRYDESRCLHFIRCVSSIGWTGMVTTLFVLVNDTETTAMTPVTRRYLKCIVNDERRDVLVASIDVSILIMKRSRIRMGIPAGGRG